MPKIIEKYGKEAFDFRQNSIVVTIPFNRLNLGTELGKNTPVTTPVGTPVKADSQITGIEEKILLFCSEARGIREIMEYLGYKEKKTVRKYLNPLIEQGRIAMTIPDKPNSSKQKYIAIQ